MQRNRKKVKSGVLLAILVLLFSITSFAEDKTGSIEIQLNDGGKNTKKENVCFVYTKVADLVDGKYELIDKYKFTHIDLNKIKYAEDLKQAATTLEKVAKKDGEVLTDKEGKATIKELSIGVYLLSVSNKAQYDKVEPLLIAIPTFDEISGEMIYDVKVMPKHTPIPPGTIVSDTPDNSSEGVKTGDDSPIFIYIGLMLVFGGSILYFVNKKRKDIEHEEN